MFPFKRLEDIDLEKLKPKLKVQTFVGSKFKNSYLIRWQKLKVDWRIGNDISFTGGIKRTGSVTEPKAEKGQKISNRIINLKVSEA